MIPLFRLTWEPTFTKLCTIPPFQSCNESEVSKSQNRNVKRPFDIRHRVLFGFPENQAMPR